jgi:hypothetical protein
MAASVCRQPIKLLFSLSLKQIRVLENRLYIYIFLAGQLARRNEITLGKVSYLRHAGMRTSISTALDLGFHISCYYTQ